MRSLQVKNIVLSPGRPKIAVPVTGVTHKDIVSQVRKIIKGPCDILEWRADYYFGEKKNLEERVENTEAHREMIRILDDIDYVTDGMPIIFTLRNHGQGGMVNLGRKHVFDLSSLAAQSKMVDFIDLELFDENDTYDEAEVRDHIREVHEFGVRVIMSYHDFDKMPTPEQMANLAGNMRGMGADIVKIAAMAKEEGEARAMMKTAEVLTSGDKDPVIMIAMGRAGMLTRVEGGKHGSCISFVKGVEETAPGQIDAETLSNILDRYYGV